MTDALWTTIGEQRRENYIYYHVQRGFAGVDFGVRTEHVQRGGLEKVCQCTWGSGVR